MRVAIVRPPIIQNTLRGVGVYSRKLLESMEVVSDVQTFEVDFDFWRVDYSGFDVVHFLYFDLFFLTLPPIRNRKTVVTIMDMTPMVLADLYPRGIRGEIKWQIQRRLVGSADHVLTLSESAKRDIHEIIGLPEEKITVTYLAGDEFSRVSDKKRLEETIRKYRLPETFICYLGDVNANKNIPGLLLSLSSIPEDVRPSLLLVGKAFSDEQLPETRDIRRQISELGLGKAVKTLGFVDDRDLGSILSLASVYVHPALYEGFGLPVVQAMRCGCPVVCGSGGGLPEVGGKAAIYADVSNPLDLADKIGQVLKMSHKEREDAVTRGYDQAKKFSWKKTAEKTIEVYGKVLRWNGG